MVYFTVSTLQLTALKINHCLPSTTESRFHCAPLILQQKLQNWFFWSAYAIHVISHLLSLFSFRPLWFCLFRQLLFYFLISLCNLLPHTDCLFYLFPFFLHWSLPLILPLPQADMVLIADCWEIHDKGEPCSTDITEPFPLGKPHKEQLQHQHTGTAQWNRIINTKSCTIMMLLSSLRTIQHCLSNLFASTELLCLTANDGNQMCNVFSPRRCFIIFSELIDP